MELDDNVRRLGIAKTESTNTAFRWTRVTSGAIPSKLPPITLKSDGLHKVGLQTVLKYQKKRHLWQLDYNIGFKHFFLTPGEDTLLNRLNMKYYYRAHRRVFMGVLLSGMDRQRTNETREYTFGQGQLHVLFWAPNGWQINGRFSYQLFDYRHLENFPEAYPDGITDGQRFSNTGEEYELSAQKRWTRTFRTRFSYDFSRKHHNFRYKKDENNPEAEQQRVIGLLEARTDHQHGLSAGFRFVYIVLIDVSYRFELLQSDSFGESNVGNRVQFMFAFELPLRFYFLFKTQLTFRSYFGGDVVIDPSQRADNDENLTAISLRLSRPILEHLRFNLQYSHFTNQLGAGVSEYKRNVLSVGLSIRY